jgi:5'-nucleotidase
MRNENRDGEGECYQVNRGVAAVYDTNADELVSLAIGGEPVDPKRTYSICLQGYHASQSEPYLAIPTDVLEAAEPKVVATSAQQVLEERLRDSKNLESVIEGRLVYRA